MTQIDGEKIARLRQELGMDQKTLAQAAGVAQSVISRIERNMQADFKVSVVHGIAQVLGVGIETLFVGQNRQEELEPELQSVFTQLKTRDAKTQLIAARILLGLISGIDEDHTD